MNEWYFDRYGQASFIVVDNERFVSKYGRNLGWVHQGKQVFSLTGQPLGWLEKGVLRDRKGGIIAFTRWAGNWLPSVPGMSGEPASPSIPGPPARPGFAGTITDPGSGSWAGKSIRDFFGADL